MLAGYWHHGLFFSALGHVDFDRCWKKSFATQVAGYCSPVHPVRVCGVPLFLV